MTIKRLPPRAIEGLRTISSPVRYLYPSPEQTTTDAPENTLLVFQAQQRARQFSPLSYQRFVQLAKSIGNPCIEQVPFLNDDALQMMNKRNLDPWTLESRRSIFTFPAWVIFITGPGEWTHVKNKLQTLYNQFRETPNPRSIWIISAYSKSLKKIDVPAELHPIDATRLPSSKRDFKTCLQTLLNGDEHRLTKTLHEPGNINFDTEDWNDSIYFPLSNLEMKQNRSFQVANPETFHKNRSVQNNIWPMFSGISSENWLHQTERAINQYGTQTISIGSIPGRSPDQYEKWSQEFMQRFQARWSRQPVCYRLDNPLPNHPLWTMDQLLNGYKNESLQVHFGNSDDWDNILNNLENRTNWLSYFQKAGGRTGTIYVTARDMQSEVPRLKTMLNKLSRLLDRDDLKEYQITFKIQPDLNGEQPVSAAAYQDAVKQIQPEQKQNRISTELHLPEKLDHFISPDRK